MKNQGDGQRRFLRKRLVSATRFVIELWSGLTVEGLLSMEFLFGVVG